MALSKPETKDNTLVLVRTFDYAGAKNAITEILEFSRNLPAQGTPEWLLDRYYWFQRDATGRQTGLKIAACGGSQISSIMETSTYPSDFIIYGGKKAPPSYMTFILNKTHGEFVQSWATLYGNVGEQVGQDILASIIGEHYELGSIPYTGPEIIPIKYSPDGISITNGSNLKKLVDLLKEHDKLNGWVGIKEYSTVFSSQLLDEDLAKLFPGQKLEEVMFMVILEEDKNRIQGKLYVGTPEAYYVSQFQTGKNIPMIRNAGVDVTLFVRNNHLFCTYDQFSFSDSYTVLKDPDRTYKSPIVDYEFKVPFACIAFLFIEKDGLIAKAKKRTEFDKEQGILSPPWYDFIDELKSDGTPMDFVKEASTADNPKDYIEKLLSAAKNGAYEVRTRYMLFPQRNGPIQPQKMMDYFIAQQKAQGHSIKGFMCMKMTRMYVRAIPREEGYIDRMAPLVHGACREVDWIKSKKMNKEQAIQYLRENTGHLTKMIMDIKREDGRDGSKKKKVAEVDLSFLK